MIRSWRTLVISFAALSAACLVACVEADGAIYEPTLQPWVPGAPVSAFGDEGTVRLEPPKGGPTFGAQVAVDPAGRVLVSTRGEEEEGFLTRLLADGTTDPRFGQAGRLDTPSGRWNDLVIDPEGRILLAGSVKGDLAVARLTPDGALDPTFGTFGVARVHLGPPALEGFVDETLERLVVLPDGSLLGAGWATPCAEACRSTSGTVIKLTPDGVLDTSFGEGGYDLLARAPRPEPGHGKGVLRRIFALAVQPDGKILIGGNDYRLIVVVRLTASGAVDGSFGKRGAFFTARETEGREGDEGLFNLGSATSILVKPSGQILVVGARVIYGLRPNGHIDPGFNPPGGGNFLGLTSLSPEGWPSSSGDAL
ncbi:MAG TPA: delta-60 repeat domain-containing protein, partial [Solirubrobacterales bacterium]|nr:delta-60 repeat domain-containing protein [Solirubrobacterales bacterium]